MKESRECGNEGKADVDRMPDWETIGAAVRQWAEAFEADKGSSHIELMARVMDQLARLICCGHEEAALAFAELAMDEMPDVPRVGYARHNWELAFGCIIRLHEDACGQCELFGGELADKLYRVIEFCRHTAVAGYVEMYQELLGEAGLRRLVELFQPELEPIRKRAPGGYKRRPEFVKAVMALRSIAEVTGDIDFKAELSLLEKPTARIYCDICVDFILDGRVKDARQWAKKGLKLFPGDEDLKYLARRPFNDDD